MKQRVIWKKRFSIYVKRVKIDSYFISCLVLSCIWHEIRLGSYKVTNLFIQILFTPYSLFASKSWSPIKEKQVKLLIIYLINCQIPFDCYIIIYIFISCKIILNDRIIEIYIILRYSNFSNNSIEKFKKEKSFEKNEEKYIEEKRGKYLKEQR